ncbi:glycosyltransferase family 4 protein [Halobacillus kuroshimensis]|uniref:glycosyltransferase family 4 protein n=1 Tax=Halobacillus kuroshimensis TaxID=302481 RepID=UPI0003FAA8BC|nr:glycosyltransferase family 4 protein [Halobacillus kuroshimensis]
MLRILYVAPRYHTNQIPIAEGLINNGYYVRFLVMYKGVTENYEALKPDILKPTFKIKALYYMILKRKGKVYAENWMLRNYKPGYIQVLRYLINLKPDIVIIRERSRQSRIVYMCCKLLGINKVILYNQKPINVYEWKGKRFKELLSKFAFPQVRYSPVKYINLLSDSTQSYPSHENHHAYFAPFVQEANVLEGEKQYGTGGIIRVLDVGKYRNYKNHKILVEAVSLMKEKENFHVTIIGQVSNKDEQDYFDNLASMIKDKNLQDTFTLLKNIPYRQMVPLYKEHDIFVLPSKKEVASISVLEAMANGLCTISTDNNGTAFYVSEGNAGLTFDNNSAQDLANKLTYLVNNPESIRFYGGNAIKHIQDNCGFNNYLESLKHIVKTEFEYNL